MTDPTEAADVASWWKRLKAANADDVEKAKELCTSGKLTELAYSDLDAFITLLDTAGGFLPPPVNAAASLVSGLCKCVQGVHLNNANLMNLRDRYLDILSLFLHVGGIKAFISTCRSSSKLPKLHKEFTNTMIRFIACIQEVIDHCENYTRERFLAGTCRFVLYLEHNENFKALTSKLRDLTALAALTLGVDHNRLLEEARDKEEARLVAIRAQLKDEMSLELDEGQEKHMDRLKVSGYSILLHQPHLKALWSKHFMREEVVRWGVWWTVFPGELALDDTLNGAAKQQLVDLLKDKDSKDALRQAVGSYQDTIYISIYELCRSFPDDSPLLPTVQALLCEGRNLVREDAVNAQNQEKMAMAEAGRNQKLAPVKKERALKAHQAQPEQGRQRGGPVQGGAQLFLSYRVPETGRKRHGGDRTVPLLKSALEAHGYSVFVGESDIDGGASWAQAIKVAITDCQVFIPVCSKTYGDTKWTFRELHQAHKANKEILPLWHSGDYPPEPVSMYLDHVQRLPRGNQPLLQIDFQSLVSDLVAAIKKAGCLPRNPPGPSNQALQGLALDQGRKRI